MDLTAAERKATYEEISDYVLEHTKIENNWNRGAVRRGKEKQAEKKRGQFYELIK